MKIAWKPHPGRQEYVLTLTPQQAYEILYGGARGGGKTDAGMAWLLYDHEHPLYRALVIRKDADDLRDWVDRARRFYAPVNGNVIGNPPEVRFKNGGIIRTGHLHDDKAYQKYQGHEYQRVLIEELTHIPTEDQYLKLRASCRSTVPELSSQLMANCNPDGPGFSWVKRRWRLDAVPKEPIWTTDEQDGLTRVFVPARIQDNPTLVKNDPVYVASLNSLPDGLREAWRDGSWSEPQIPGAYYALALLQARKDGRVKMIPYDPSLKVHTVWDLGIGEHLVCGFFQKTNVEIRLIDTWQGEGSDSITEGIAMLQRKKYVYGKHFAPHDANQREKATGQTVVDVAKKLGITFYVVPSLLENQGITKVLLMWPRLWINEQACGQFLEAIRQFRKQWDEKRLDWRPEPFEDWTNHYADMLRYAALVENNMTNYGLGLTDEEREELLFRRAMKKKQQKERIWIR